MHQKGKNYIWLQGKLVKWKKHSVKFKHQKKELIVKLREDIIIHCLPSNINIITVYLLAKGPAAVVPKQTKEWELLLSEREKDVRKTGHEQLYLKVGIA